MKNNLTLTLLFILGTCYFISCSDDEIGNFKELENKISIEDINRSWGISRESILLNQGDEYELIQNDESCIIFSKDINESGNIYVSYMFDQNNSLCASILSMPDKNGLKSYADKLFAQYDSEILIIDNTEVKIIDNSIITYDISTDINLGNIVTIGFSYFEPLEKRDDCVDLGLSVRWATTNLGANSPTDVGDFYAWSETSTKSEYWRENYSFCSNYNNKYIFDYYNPTSNICGTKYDVATKKLGEGWKCPSLVEANELITKCTWKREIVNEVEVIRITGPNGKSIILPEIGRRVQNKEHQKWFCISLGESPSRTDESCYTLETYWDDRIFKGTIKTQWKAWGYNIRPVYTK